MSAGADVVTVHVESCARVHRVLQQLGTMKNANDAARGIVRGIALNPGTPLEAIEPLLDDVDLVLLLAVNRAGRTTVHPGDDRPDRAGPGECSRRGTAVSSLAWTADHEGEHPEASRAPVSIWW